MALLLYILIRRNRGSSGNSSQFIYFLSKHKLLKIITDEMKVCVLINSCIGFSGNGG